MSRLTASMSTFDQCAGRFEETDANVTGAIVDGAVVQTIFAEFTLTRSFEDDATWRQVCAAVASADLQSAGEVVGQQVVADALSVVADLDVSWDDVTDVSTDGDESSVTITFSADVE